MTVGFILGSAYHDAQPLGVKLTPQSIATPDGDVLVPTVQMLGRSNAPA